VQPGAEPRLPQAMLRELNATPHITLLPVQLILGGDNLQKTKLMFMEKLGKLGIN